MFLDLISALVNHTLFTPSKNAFGVHKRVESELWYISGRKGER